MFDVEENRNLEIQGSLYIAEIQRSGTIFLPLIARVYLHSSMLSTVSFIH